MTATPEPVSVGSYARRAFSPMGSFPCAKHSPPLASNTAATAGQIERNRYMRGDSVESAGASPGYFFAN
jgi:hypothetical protein